MLFKFSFELGTGNLQETKITQIHFHFPPDLVCERFMKISGFFLTLNYNIKNVSKHIYIFKFYIFKTAEGFEF